MTSKELGALIEQGEGFHLEFKESVKSSLAKEFVAFANAKGGRVLIGVDDNDTLVGRKLSNCIRSDIQNIARGCDAPIDVDIETVDGEPTVLVINVGEGLNKPYKCSDGFYLREGPNSTKRTAIEIGHMFKDAGLLSFDDVLVQESNFSEEFEPATLQRFLSEAKITQRLSDENTVVNLGAAKMVGAEVVLNNTGVLFFTKDLIKHCMHAIIQCARFNGTTKVNIDDQQDLTKDIIANIDDCFAFLKKHLNIGFDFKINAPKRTEVWEIPFPAIKEAVINAIAHRDYVDKGTHVQVFVFDDKVTIGNFGGLFGDMTIDDLGTKTYRRNPNIVNLLHRAGFIERMGTGILRINQELEAAGLPEAEIEADRHWFTITFKRAVELKPTDRFESSNYIPTEKEREILKYCLGELKSRKEILEHIGYSNHSSNYKRHMVELLKNELLLQTEPENPNNPNQKYYTSNAGGVALSNK